MDQTKYLHDDQFICAVEGKSYVYMVPHVNHQEMYTGSEFGIFDEAQNLWRYYRADVNESPINLFQPDLTRYPNFRFIENQYSVELKRGDCVYVPAFYFYQLAAEAEVQVLNGKTKPTAITATLVYEAQSDMASAFYDAIEQGVL